MCVRDKGSGDGLLSEAEGRWTGTVYSPRPARGSFVKAGWVSVKARSLLLTSPVSTLAVAVDYFLGDLIRYHW